MERAFQFKKEIISKINIQTQIQNIQQKIYFLHQKWIFEQIYAGHRRIFSNLIRIICWICQLFSLQKKLTN